MENLKYIAFGLIGLGVVMLFLGMAMHFMKWPDMFYQTIIGPILIGIGLVLLLISRNKK